MQYWQAPSNREPFRWLVASGLLPALAVAHKDSRYSKAQCSPAGRLNSLGPILHRAIISNGRMQNDEPKKNGAVLFSTVYFNAVLAGSIPTNRARVCTVSRLSVR